MFWFGLMVTIVFTAGFGLKACVVWSASRCPHGGGGAPTLDFILFYPLFLAFGVATLLGSLNASPFPYFGVVLYGLLLSLAVGVFWLFHRLGARYLANMRQRTRDRD